MVRGYFCRMMQDCEEKQSRSHRARKKTDPNSRRRPVLSSEEVCKLCSFIKELSKSLKLTSAMKSTALIFFHRFHTQYEGSEIQTEDHMYDMATTCVFLACKVEDKPIYLEEVLNTAHSLRTGDEVSLSRNEEKMWTTRERVMLFERILLDTMSFNITIEHPHVHAKSLIRENFEDDHNVQQTTYNILNDCLSTVLCVQYSAKEIAAAAVLLAGRFLQMKGKPDSSKLQAILDKLEIEKEAFGLPLPRLILLQDKLLSSYEEGRSTKRVRISSQ